jgi:hypothetical protein
MSDTVFMAVPNGLSHLSVWGNRRSVIKRVVSSRQPPLTALDPGSERIGGGAIFSPLASASDVNTPFRSLARQRQNPWNCQRGMIAEGVAPIRQFHGFIVQTATAPGKPCDAHSNRTVTILLSQIDSGSGFTNR